MERSDPGEPDSGSQDTILERRAAEGKAAEHAADLQTQTKKLLVSKKEPSKRIGGSSAQHKQSQE